jgi:hypothetical protein
MTGKNGGQGRVERVQEMGEMVETVLGIRDGIQVNSSFLSMCFEHTGIVIR